LQRAGQADCKLSGPTRRVNAGAGRPWQRQRERLCASDREQHHRTTPRRQPCTI